MVLVVAVEDDPINAVLVSTALTRDGHQVLTAPDGLGGLESVRTWRPDIVLLDVSLAGPMNGLDVCRELRRDPVTARIPVLMLSGWAFDTDLEAGRAAGADGYLSKPFSASDLQTMVGILLDRAAARALPADP
jgi:CheY-like chemotaxis protein